MKRLLAINRKSDTNPRYAFGLGVAASWVMASVLGLGCFSGSSLAEQDSGEFASHPPMRPLPRPSMRPLPEGALRFVDGNRGDDAHEGSQEQPWRTLSRAVRSIEPGTTIVLRSGVYYEHVRIQAKGRARGPITIRAYPGELAILDGGLREFAESPQHAWLPLDTSEAATDEYISTKRYPELGGRPGASNLLGNFADSMVPLHGYRYLEDLRSRNEYLAQVGAGKTEAGSGAYCGPGLFLNTETGRIHVRLAHTNQRALGNANYRGERDPRRLPLIIAGASAGPTLSIESSANVRIQDLVVRGARTATVSILDSDRVDLDGVTMYGGASPIQVQRTSQLRVWNCACRGIAAPWTFRGSLKYRAIEARLFSASGWVPQPRGNRDFEIAYSEFTDCVDGVFIGNVANVEFHHNLLDNISDDGIFVTATTAYDGTTPGGNIHVYQNLLSRCLTTFAFGVGHGRQKMTVNGRQTGAGIYVYRNVFDLRRPVHYQQPEEGEAEITSYGRVSGDHGGPLWEPIYFYQNTVVLKEAPFRQYYGAGLGSHLGPGSKRYLFNNLFLQIAGQPGHVLPTPAPPGSDRPKVAEGPKKKGLELLLDQDATRTRPKKANATPARALPASPIKKPAGPAAPIPVDFQTDANLHWSYAEATTKKQLFGRFLDSDQAAVSQKIYAPGWIADDLVADPRLADFQPAWESPWDLGLQRDSPGRNSGLRLNDAWPDPLRREGKPDLGALPYGAEPWPVGVDGRIDVLGRSRKRRPVAPPPRATSSTDAAASANHPSASGNAKPVVIAEGYPAFDAPLLRFALEKQGKQVETLEKNWLPPSEYENYSTVVLVGNLVRAKIEPNTYAPEDLSHVRRFLEQGGTLLLMRGTPWVFRTPHGQRFLLELAGAGGRTQRDFSILQPEHPWVRGLPTRSLPEWVNIAHAEPIRISKGIRILGNSQGDSTLFQLPVGKGQLIYLGWDIAASQPSGRRPSTVAQETAFAEQMQLLLALSRDL